MLKGQLAQLQKDLGGIKEMKSEPVQYNSCQST